MNLQYARELFDSGDRIPAGLLNQHILESWTRSRQSGVRFADKVIGAAPTAHEHKRLLEENRFHLAHADPELQALMSVLCGDDWAVSFLDMTGRVVSSLCRATADFPELALAFRTGVNLGETGAGTTGPSCALSSGRVTVVSGEEHFLQEAAGFCCTAAPVFDPQGRMVGAVNAATSTSRSKQGIPDIVRMLADRISDRMVLGIKNAMQFEITVPMLTVTQYPGKLAVSKDGQILGANRAAAELLGLGSSRNQRLDDLLDAHLGQILDSLSSKSVDRLNVRTSSGIALEIRSGAASTKAVAVSKPANRTEITCSPLPLEMQSKAQKCLLAFRHGISILVQGETGTGKEQFAKWLHQNSPRAKGPLIAVNCSAIPSDLVEAELFGYEAGAFTGASNRGMSGKLRQAHGGTLFLDEIGDMPLHAQSKLLRVLQERKVQPLGSAKEIPVEFTVVSATHRDLAESVRRGDFRQDLYFRICGMSITLPALRDRSDLLDLIGRFLKEFANSSETPIDPLALQALAAYPWPGNLRQLKSVIEVLTLMCDDQISVSDLPAEFKEVTQTVVMKNSTLAMIERSTILRTLESNQGNVSATARALNISRATLYSKLKQRH